MRTVVQGRFERRRTAFDILLYRHLCDETSERLAEVGEVARLIHVEER